MKFSNLMQKVATLLEKTASQLDKQTSEKLASQRREMEERLEPAITYYEKISKQRLSDDAREQIFSGENETLIAMLEKLASDREAASGPVEEYGGSEKGAFRRTMMPSIASESGATHQKVASQHREGNRTFRGRRRDGQEIKRQTRMRETTSTQ